MEAGIGLNQAREVINRDLTDLDKFSGNSGSNEKGYKEEQKNEIEDCKSNNPAPSQFGNL